MTILPFMAPRRYDSSRRRQAAARTREQILKAAMKLHWEGVTEFEPLAREAGVSLASVRKHFPTREALFGSCTHAFAGSVTFPDLDALGAISDPDRRLVACVSELCRMHEAMFGYAWLSARLREESPTLDQVMRGYEGLADAMTGLITAGDSHRAPVARGLLDFLTYRAMRLSGGLSPEAVRAELTATLRSLIPGGTGPAATDQPKEKP